MKYPVLPLNRSTSDRANTIYVFGGQIVHRDIDGFLHGFTGDVLGTRSGIISSDYSENFVHSSNLSFLKPESTCETKAARQAKVHPLDDAIMKCMQCGFHELGLSARLRIYDHPDALKDGK